MQEFFLRWPSEAFPKAHAGFLPKFFHLYSRKFVRFCLELSLFSSGFFPAIFLILSLVIYFLRISTILCDVPLDIFPRKTLRIFAGFFSLNSPGVCPGIYPEVNISKKKTKNLGLDVVIFWKQKSEIFLNKIPKNCQEIYLKKKIRNIARKFLHNFPKFISKEIQNWLLGSISTQFPKKIPTVRY